MQYAPTILWIAGFNGINDPFAQPRRGGLNPPVGNPNGTTNPMGTMIHDNAPPIKIGDIIANVFSVWAYAIRPYM